MSSIDERIVQMEFDNGQFEKGVQTSLESLEKLKSSLELKDAGKGLAAVDREVRNVNLQPLIDSVETINDRFSALGIIGTTALIKLTNQAIDSGERLVKSLSVDQIASGWSKYADKTAAVQTIMSATRSTWQKSAKELGFEGTQMEYVNSQLDKLNWFTDETSYNFLDMVNNIGKFTNNGVALDKAVTSMEGISTWAALSGGNIQEAGRAMYNFSQAMGAGSMKLQDWKSIENANMATMEFKQAVIDTAIAAGKLKEVAPGMYAAINPKQGKATTFTIETFAQSLKDAWFDTQVMTDSLQKFGGFAVELGNMLDDEQISRYYHTTSQLLDDLDDFKTADAEGQLKILTDASKVTGISVDELREKFEHLNSDELDLGKRAFKSAQEAKTFAEAIDSVKDAVSTGWMTTFDLIFGNYEEAKVLWTDLANTLYDLFAESGNARNAVLQLWRDEAGRETFFEGVAEAFESILRLTEPVKDALAEVFHTDDLQTWADLLVGATKKFKEWAESIWLSDEAYANLKGAFKGVFTIVKLVAKGIGAVIKILSVFTQPLNALAYAVSSIAAKIGNLIFGFGQAVEKSSTLSSAFNTIYSVAQKIAYILTVVIGITGILIEKFIDFIAKSRILSTAINGIKVVIGTLVGIIGGIAAAIGTLVLFLASTGIRVIGAIRTGITTITTKLENMFPVLRTLGTKIRSFFGLLKREKAPTDGFSVIGTALSSLAAKISPAVTVIRSKLSSLTSAIMAFAAANGPKILAALSTAFDKFKMTASMAFAALLPLLQKISDAFRTVFTNIMQTDWGNLGKALLLTVGVVIGAILKIKSSILVFVSSFLAAADKFDFVKDHFTKVIDKIKEKVSEMAKSNDTETIKEKIRDFVDFVKSKLGDLTPASVMLFVFAAAMATSMFKIGTAFENFGKLANKAGNLFGIPALVKKLTDAIKATQQITQIAAALSIISGSLYLISKIPLNDLVKAGVTLLVISGALAAITFAMNNDKFKSEEFVKNAKSFALLAAAIGILSGALFVLSKITAVEGIKEKAIGLAVLIAALGGTAIMLNKFAPDFKTSSSSIIGISVAILILTKALKDINEIAKGNDIETAVRTMERLMLGLGVVATLASQFGFFKSLGLLNVAVSILALDLVLKYLMAVGISAQEVIEHLDTIIPTLSILGLILLSTQLVGENAMKAGVAALAISVAIVVLSGALRLVAGMSRDYSWLELGVGMVTIGAMLAALSLVFKQVAGLKGTALSASAAILAVSAGILLLSLSLKRFGDLAKDVENDIPGQGLLRLIVTVGMIGALAIALGFAAGLSKEAKTSAILAMMAGLAMILTAVSLMSYTDHPVVMMLSAIAVAGLLYALGKALAMAGNAAKEAKTSALLMMVAIIGVTLGGLAYLANQPWKGILAGGSMLAVVLMAVTAALETAAAGGRKSIAGAKALALMVIPLAASVAAIKVLETVNLTWKLVGLAVIIAALMAAMAGCAKHARLAFAGAKAMALMSVPLLAATAGLKVLSDPELNWQNMGVAAISLMGIMVVLAAAAKYATGAVAGAGAMVVMGIAVIEVAAALRILAGCDWKSIGMAAVAIGVLSAAFTLLGFFMNASGFTLAIGMLAAAGCLAALGLALGIFALAAWGFAKAVDIIVNAFQRLGGMSSEEVSNAVTAIQEFGIAVSIAVLTIGASIAQTISTVGQSITTTVLDVGTAIGTAIQQIGFSIGAGMANIIVGFITTLVTGIATLLGTVISTIVSFVGPIVSAAATLIGGFINGIVSMAGAVASAFGSLVSTAIGVLQPFISAFQSIGSFFGLGTAQGINSSAPSVTTAASGLGTFAKNALSGALGLLGASPVGQIIGKFFGASLAQGIDDSNSVVQTASTVMGKTAENGLRDTLDIHSKSPLIMLIGKFVGWSAAQGITDSGPDVNAATTNMAQQNILNPLQAAANAARGILATIGSYASGAGSLVGSMYRTATGTGGVFSKAFDKVNIAGSKAKAKKQMNDFLGSMANPMEYAKFFKKKKGGGFAELGKKALGSFTEGATEDLKNQFEDLGKAAGGGGGGGGGAAGGVEKATKAIKENLDIMEIGSGAVNEFANRYGDCIKAVSDVDPVEAGKSAVEALARATYEASKAAEDAAGTAKAASEDAEGEIEKIEQAFLKLKSSVASTISGQLDIFSEYKKGDKIKPTALLKNMKNNLRAVEKYGEDMEMLAERGVSQPLLEKLAGMGQKGLNTIEAFMKMTDSQLKEANEMMERSLVIPDETSDKVLASYAYAGQMAAGGFAQGVEDGTAEATQAVSDMAESGVRQLENDLDIHSPSRVTAGIGGNFVLGFINGVTGLVGDVVQAATTMATSAISTLAQMASETEAFTIGQNVAVGFAKGIADGASIAIQAATDMAKNALQAAKDALEINSPSRAFEDVGLYSNLGFADGLTKYGKITETAAEGMANGAIMKVQTAVAIISDLINNGIDDAPTITPVLDLSQMVDGVNQAGSLLNGGSLAAASSIQIQNERMNLISAMHDAIASAMTGTEGSNINGGVNIYVYGTEGQSPSEIAEAVEERLLVKFNRLRAARA